MLIADRYRGLAMQAEEAGYPAEQVGLFCEVMLRNALDLEDYDLILFSTVEPIERFGEAMKRVGPGP